MALVVSPDKPRWFREKSKVFSMKYVYKYLNKKNCLIMLIRYFGKLKFLSKIKIYMWLIWGDAILTKRQSFEEKPAR